MREKKGIAAGAAILSALLVVLTAVGVFYYFRVYKPSINEMAAESTSYSADNRGAQKDGSRTLVAENEGVSVYKDGDYAIIVSGDTEAEFSEWGANFGSIATEVYNRDFNNDEKKDIIILDNEGKISDSDIETYGFYLLTPAEDDSDNPYSVYYTNGENWLDTFNEIVTCYLSQPQAYPNLLQFVMDYSTTEVQFDSQTGLALPQFRAHYTKALEADGGEYEKLSSFRLSQAVIDYDDDTNIAGAEVYVYAKYENGEEQNIGSVSIGIELYEGALAIKGQSVIFTAADGLAADEPQR